MSNDQPRRIVTRDGKKVIQCEISGEWFDLIPVPSETGDSFIQLGFTVDEDGRWKSYTIGGSDAHQ